MPHLRKGPHGPPHHQPHGPGHGHHQPHGHGPEWLICVSDPSMPREQYAEHLGALADTLKAGIDVQINGTTIPVPAKVEFELRFERTPHDSKALVIRAEWFDDDDGADHSTPADGLVIGPAGASATG